MFWIGFGIAIAGFFIGLGLEKIGESIEKLSTIRSEGK